ncbi:MAG TPA: APC family permease [Planctomycetaceae bacterium]|nr:APC family permease [Planctomycetaceae bacterium]
MSEPAISPPATMSLPRVLTLLDGTTLVVGAIIGSGIFLKVDKVDGALQAFGFGPIIGVWVLMGFITLCGSLALGELAALYPQAGGPYVYLREVYGRLPAFLWGWTEFWVVRTGAIGALACATTLYLDQIVPLTHPQQMLTAIAIVVGLSLSAILSTKGSAAIQNWLTFIKVSFLAAIIVLPVAMGYADAGPGHWQPVWQPSGGTGFWEAMGVAIMAVMWPYHGWIDLAPVAEEIKEPERNVPRALAMGLGIVAAIYVLANLSYHLMFTMAEISQTKTIAADVFKVLFGPIGAKIAAAGVMCSTLGANNATVMCGPRIYFAMARDGLLPARLQHVHARWQTPANAIFAQGVWAVLLILVFFAWKEQPKAAFDALTDSVVCAGLVFFSMTVGAVYILRRTRPDAPRAYRTWGYPITPALLIGVYAFAFVRQMVDAPQQTFAIAGLIASGAVYYAWATRKTARI